MIKKHIIEFFKYIVTKLSLPNYYDKIVFKGIITFYFLKQPPYPKLALHWRWKQLSGTFDTALIVYGYWFGMLIDHEIFMTIK